MKVYDTFCEMQGVRPEQAINPVSALEVLEEARRASLRKAKRVTSRRARPRKALPKAPPRRASPRASTTARARARSEAA